MKKVDRCCFDLRFMVLHYTISEQGTLDGVQVIREALAGRICNNFLRDCALFDKSMKLCTDVDL